MRDTRGQRDPAKATPMGEASLRDKEILLELGDIVQRVPLQYLKRGLDMHMPVRLKVRDLISDISRGKPTIPLSHIARFCPEIFSAEVKRNEEVEIIFPWQKVMAQIRMFQQPATEQQPAVEQSATSG